MHPMIAIMSVIDDVAVSADIINLLFIGDYNTQNIFDKVNSRYRGGVAVDDIQKH